MVRLSSIVIGVSDLTKARPFYEDLLGMSFNEFRPPFACAVLGNVEFNIEENADYRPDDWAKNYIGGRKPVGLAVDDLETFLMVVRQQGFIVVHEPIKQPWGWVEAVIADIDGNEFVVEQEV